MELASPAYFSPFPHGTASLSVARKYLALREGSREFPRTPSDSVVLGFCTIAFLIFNLHDFHILLCGFPADFEQMSQNRYPRPRQPRHATPRHQTGNAPRFNTRLGLGSSQFARRYYGNRFYFLFLQVLRWFNSLSSRLLSYEFTLQIISSTDIRFSHSEIFGSMLACSSPKLIAAGHVFHQSLAPRHPP